LTFWGVFGEIIWLIGLIGLVRSIWGVCRASGYFGSIWGDCMDYKAYVYFGSIWGAFRAYWYLGKYLGRF